MSCTLQNSQKFVGKEDLSSFVATGNALPLLHEIKHALDRLLAGGEATIIDLGALPFAPGDERIVNDVLGDGEVSAAVSVLGESLVRETGIAGVWRVDHFDEKGEYQSRFIEITFLPEILKSQREDTVSGVETLSERLNALDQNR